VRAASPVCRTADAVADASVRYGTIARRSQWTVLDTLPACMREILGSASRGNGPPRGRPQEPGCPQALGSRVPHGTTQKDTLRGGFPNPLLDGPCQPGLSDQQRCIVIPVQDQPTVRTDVGPD
jgi:hypothetical protein